MSKLPNIYGDSNPQNGANKSLGNTFINEQENIEFALSFKEHFIDKGLISEQDPFKTLRELGVSKDSVNDENDAIQLIRIYELVRYKLWYERFINQKAFEYNPITEDEIDRHLMKYINNRTL